MLDVIARSCLAVLLISASGVAARAQCRRLEEKIFQPQNKRVRLVARAGDAAGAGKVIFFKTSLRVNTDGAPNSYHPQDLTGTQKAINNICNGIAVSKVGRDGRETTLGCPEARSVFARFRDDNWVAPPGYRISWQNVIAPRVEGGRTTPCVFRAGEFAGYFGSLTSLKNGLPDADAGECNQRNQLDQRVVPAFVLPGGQNVVRGFGAGVGDLLLAVNPANGLASVAVVGDTGPADKLGEGSVGLNMALLGRAAQPRTYREALGLDTGNSEMLIAIIPGSRSFRPRRPYTKENIADRLDAWAGEAGFGTREKFADFMKSCDR